MTNRSRSSDTHTALTPGADAPEFNRSAIARIDILDATGKSISRGTGTLVAPGMVLTALHVVAFRKAETLTPKGPAIKLTFPGFTTLGAIISGDNKDDWALIECAEEPPIAPMPVAKLTESNREWQSYGFPDAQQADGMLVSGNVSLCDGQFEGVPAHQLYCQQAASGGGGMVKGLSGSPVIIDGKVIGVMRSALMQQDRTEMGTLYACPARALQKKRDDIPMSTLGRIDRHRLTTQIEIVSGMKGWELAALFGAFAVIATAVTILSQVSVPSARIEGALRVTDAYFVVSKRAPVMLENADRGWLAVSYLKAGGAKEVTVPNAAFGVDTIRTPGVFQIFRSGTGLQSEGAPEVFVNLEAPLERGTHTFVHRTPTPGRYALSFMGDSSPTPILVQLKLLGFMNLKTRDSSFELPHRRAGQPAFPPGGYEDSIRLVPSMKTPLRMEIDIPPKSTVTLNRAVPVDTLRLMTRDYTGDNTFVPASSILAGHLRIDGPNGRDIALEEHDDLLLRNSSLSIDRLEFPAEKGGILVTFGGRASGLSITRHGNTIDEMPTWLDRLRSNYPIQSALLGAAIVAGLAFQIMAWRRRQLA